ncbi:MAG: hypothetical protein HYU99_04860 [Deltaproteobacteria bacterium]|nr:hypothetical protein [Deltaproteobacteria bacterium]
MGDSVSASAGADVSGSVHLQTEEDALQFPVSGMGYAHVVLRTPPDDNREFDLSANAKVMVWGGTADDPSTILALDAERWYVYALRLNVVPNHFGITHLNVAARSKTLDLAVLAGVKPQEDGSLGAVDEDGSIPFFHAPLPYNFNGTTLTLGDYTWAAPTLRYSGFDNSSWANIYTGKIGPMVGAEWAPNFGLVILFQAGPDGGFQPSGSWVKTGHISYSHEWSDGVATSAAVHASSLNPAEATNQFDDTVSPTNGAGVFIGQTAGPLTLGGGYSLKKQSLEGEGISSLSRYDSANFGASYQFEGPIPVVWTGAVMLLYFKEETDAFVDTLEKTHEVAVEPANFTIGFAPGWALTLGGAFVRTDPDSQTSTEVFGPEMIVYGVLTFNVPTRN